MERILVGLGATVGGYVGWWLGESFGIMTAFLLSIVFTGVGVYAGRQSAKRYLP